MAAAAVAAVAVAAAVAAVAAVAAGNIVCVDASLRRVAGQPPSVPSRNAISVYSARGGVREERSTRREGRPG